MSVAVQQPVAEDASLGSAKPLEVLSSQLRHPKR